MAELPPDLDRLGTVLTTAAAHVNARRAHSAERRRRLLGCLAAGLLVFAAAPASHLAGADHPAKGTVPFRFLTTAPAEAAVFCDTPHGSLETSEDCVLRRSVPRPAR
jgi:hypothetical protein